MSLRVSISTSGSLGPNTIDDALILIGLKLNEESDDQDLETSLMESLGNITPRNHQEELFKIIAQKFDGENMSSDLTELKNRAQLTNGGISFAPGFESDPLTTSLYAFASSNISDLTASRQQAGGFLHGPSAELGSISVLENSSPLTKNLALISHHQSSFLNQTVVNSSLSILRNDLSGRRQASLFERIMSAYTLSLSNLLLDSERAAIQEESELLQDSHGIIEDSLTTAWSLLIHELITIPDPEPSDDGPPEDTEPPTTTPEPTPTNGGAGRRRTDTGISVGSGDSILQPGSTIETIEGSTSPTQTPTSSTPKTQPTAPEIFPLKDITGHWAESVIKSWFDRGLIKGRQPGYFQPDEPINRAEFCTLLVRLYQIDVSKSSSEFSDVAESAWYSDNVSACEKAGLVQGYTNGKLKLFKPDDHVILVDAIKMVLAAEKRTVKSGPISYLMNYLSPKYPQMKKYSRFWYYDQLTFALDENLIPRFANREFLPWEKVTRADVVWMIDQLINP